MAQYLVQIASGLFSFWAGAASSAMFSATLPKLEHKHSVDTAHEKNYATGTYAILEER